MEDVEEIPQGDSSRRFAVMGCDWDHVSAGDLLVGRANSGNKNLLVDDSRGLLFILW